MEMMKFKNSLVSDIDIPNHSHGVNLVEVVVPAANPSVYGMLQIFGCPTEWMKIICLDILKKN